jgi:acetyl esterase/lipase
MRVSHLTVLLSVLCQAAAIAAPFGPTTTPAPKYSPVPNGIRVERDIEYVTGGGIAQSLDLYLPEKRSDKPLPLIVYFHGGGWYTGSKAGCPQTQWLVPHGYAVASVEYRFSQFAIFPAQIQDAQAAVRWLRAHAKKYNVDSEKFGAMGGSAGGHIVALLGTSGGKKVFPPIGGNEEVSDRVQAVVDLYGPSNFVTVAGQARADSSIKFGEFNPYEQLIGGKVPGDREKCEAVSPMHYISKDAPPFLIMHGVLDQIVPYGQGETLAAALREAGGDIVFQKFPDSGHAGPAFVRPVVTDLIAAFFDKHLKGADVKVEALPESAVMLKSSPVRAK